MSGGDHIPGPTLMILPSGGPADPPGFEPETVATIQALLDGITAHAAWEVPIRDEAGEILDFEIRAVSPDARDVHGRTGKDLIGMRAFGAYPPTEGSSLREAYLRVLETGEPEDIPQYVHTEATEGVPHRSTYTLRVARVHGGLLVTWTHDDEEERIAARLASTERLGNLGWGRWNLVTGEVDWSDQLYRMHRRDPADGPLDLEQYRAITHPEDLTIVDQAVAAFDDGGTSYEYELRVLIGDEYRVIRNMAEVSRDAAGGAVEIYGLMQDVTDWRRTTHQLADARQRLEEESRLAAELQHIIMPAQEEILSLPALRVAVRYDTAETAPLGGDWYQAIPLSDDEALLAVGDVAGSGLAAAAAMAKLRHAITGLGFADQGPDRILVTLNRLLRRIRPDVLATAVVARFRAKDRTLTFTHAGHPPMLLVRGSQVHRLLHPGVLLGVFDDVTYSAAQVRLQPDDLVVMFTDGLIELPGRDLFEGLDLLGESIAEAVRAAPADRLAAVMSVLVPSNTSDDTCILVAHLRPDSPEVP
ncbi:SpoIIE family protein phosphatase [Planobispora takensis]|uniref:PPM-type phosphatase domain-containing protein n=1 Tax=Planobispora takensis TaxID=1367882 RepID=A0A8J3SW89_9ACTN|nr:SpoIIE family protein phosphatase [Planobispora takensis]GII01799.1 hypothetical protein Pta02_38070 [Planobispora takensis]